VSTFHILLAAFFCILYTQSRYNWFKLTVTVLLGGIYLLSYGKSQLIDNVYVTRATEVLMLVLSVYGVVQSFRRTKNKKKLNLEAIAKDVLVWVAVLVVCSLPAVLTAATDGISYVGKGVISALMSFGGGDAYLTIADGLFVDGGFVTSHQFYGQIVTLVNVLPGSILCKTLSGVGYYAGLDLTGEIGGGLAFALAGFACSIAMSCGCFAIVYYLYDSMTSLGVFKLVSRWIRPIISGLLVNIMLSLLNQDIAAAGNAGISTAFALTLAAVMYVMNLVLDKKFKCKQTIILLLNIAIPLVLLLFI
jgi:chromate transporter